MVLKKNKTIKKFYIVLFIILCISIVWFFFHKNGLQKIKLRNEALFEVEQKKKYLIQKIADKKKEIKQFSLSPSLKINNLKNFYGIKEKDEKIFLF
jgi:hypothetical protein